MFYTEDPMKNNFENFITSILNCISALETYSLKLTGNETDAKDLVQDTIYKALIHYDSYVERGIILYWLIQIMRNIYLNNVRQRSEMRIVRDNDIANVVSIIKDKKVSQTDDAMMLNDVLRIINGFSLEFREPMLLRMAGFRYDEIANRLGIPEGTVKSRIHFARKRLRLLLDK